MTGIWNTFHRASIGLTSLLVLASTACSVTAELSPPGTGDAGGSTTDRGGGDDVVTVTLRNLTDSEAVDVELHTTEEQLANIPTDLFDPDNNFLVVRNIGVGGSGRLAPGQIDTIELDCAPGLLLGTSGGTFVDNESGDERGRGDVRWVQEGAQFSCGATIIFEFAGDGGAFSTGLLIGDENDNDSGP